VERRDLHCVQSRVLVAALWCDDAGGSQHFPRVLAEWVALTGQKQHEDFLVELPGYDAVGKYWTKPWYFGS